MTMQNTNYKEYRTAINRCMITMLCMFFLMEVLFGLLQLLIAPLIAPLLVPVAYEVVYQLLYGLCYALSFMLPAILFKIIYPKHEYFAIPAAPRLPKHTGKLIITCVGMVYAASFVNSLIMTIFYNFLGAEPDMSLFETEINGIHSCILLFITTALIPGFVEEFLFRGVFMRNLLPYGKTVAVVVSSFLFALMHQNFLQFFYTFMAGIVFGFLFLKTGSIWCGVLAHTVNNGLSVIFSDICGHYLNEDASLKVNYLMHVVVAFVSIICLMLLIKDHKKKKELKKGSVFGVTETIDVPDGSRALTDREALKGFLSPLTYVVAVMAILYAIMVLSQILVPFEPVM